MIDKHDLETIDAMSWNDAEGITEDIKATCTNTMLAPRDYSVKCRIPHKIGVFHGIHVWWCSSHFQPLFHCDLDKKKEAVRSFAQAVIDNDRTETYRYSEENNRHQKPGVGQRWASPMEMAKSFIKNL